MKPHTFKTVLAAAWGSTLALAGSAFAQTKLKFAHVYETSEPYTSGRCGRQRDRSAPPGATRCRCSRPRSWARRPTSTRA
ncbi:MAG: hypothetical protein U1F67_12215 [Rubrivivax sp.]